MKFLFAIVICFFTFQVHAQVVVPPEIIKQLEATGLTGLMHGVDPDRGLYVFNYNVPGDFFKRFEFSVLPTSEAQLALLKTLRRGDRVFLKGYLGAQPTPQPHVYVQEFKLLEKYDPGVDAPAGRHSRDTQLPEDLKNKTDFVGQVHAVIAGGAVVVVEYKETIIPLVVTETEFTQDLFRGDLIRVYFVIQTSPGRPAHVVLKSSQALGKAPIEVLERLVDRNSTTKTLIGRLVLFPKSPTISRDVWAIEEDLGYGLARYSTLVNFTAVDDKLPELNRIDAKLRAFWNSKPEGVFEGRNKFIHTEIRIRATGVVTVFMPNQANAQLNLTADDIQLEP